MNFISYAENRMFVDIAYSGCGSGCKYCYVETASEKQKLINEKEKSKIINELLLLKKEIVSFSPNTEPFKSDESARIVIDIITQIIHSGVLIQISTKEKINKKYLEILNNMCVRDGQVVINVSLPFLSNSLIEPKASKVNERLENFELISKYNNITCSLYIKPFTMNAYNNIHEYIKIINKYNLEYVCIGMEFFNNNRIEACKSYYDDEIMIKTIEKNNIKELLLFSEQLRNKTKSKIYFSTTCIFENYGLNVCSAKFYNFGLKFCDKCKLKGEYSEKK